MYEDEAGFGRINRPKRCWAPKGIRPAVPCHYVREYMYAFGAVEPKTGDFFSLVLPRSNTDWMNLFLAELSKKYSDSLILLCWDGAPWHRSIGLKIPENIELFRLLPYTPEEDPIEQIWKEIRKEGFRNEAFNTLKDVVDRLCDTINSLSPNTIKSITGREWLLSFV